MVRAVTKGFTLIELLVAIFVFAILSVVVYNALGQVLLTSRLTDDRADKVAELQRVVGLMERDFLQIAPRPIVDEFSQKKAAVVIESIPYPRIEFSRTGILNPQGKTRSSITRIAYGMQNGSLIRTTWNVLDRGVQTQPAYEEVILEKIENLSFRGWFDDEWQQNWPSVEAQIIEEGEETGKIPFLQQTPRAVELNLVVDDKVTIHRLFAGVGG